MLTAKYDRGRVTLTMTANDGTVTKESLEAPVARELARDMVDACNRIEGWNWMPGGGSVDEEVIHVDNHWYSPKTPPKSFMACLVTTEGPEGRGVNVALFVPAKKVRRAGKLIEVPEHWSIPMLSIDLDGRSLQEKIVAWCPMPRPSVCCKRED